VAVKLARYASRSACHRFHGVAGGVDGGEPGVSGLGQNPVLDGGVGGVLPSGQLVRNLVVEREEPEVGEHILRVEQQPHRDRPVRGQVIPGGAHDHLADQSPLPGRDTRSRRASTANRIARSRSPSGYFRRAHITLIPTSNESLHQTGARQ